MRFLLTISLLGWLSLAHAESVRILIQRSPLAGAQHYAVGELLPIMQIGDRLELIREPDNRHDRHAIRVEWRGRKLGYVPRAENQALAAALDSGDKLLARIAHLSGHANPWQRLEFEVFMVL